jgi:hypothetical protein
VLHDRKQRQTFIYWHKTSGGSQKALRSHQDLEARNLVADRCLGHPQLNSGARKIPLPHSDFECAQSIARYVG